MGVLEHAESDLLGLAQWKSSPDGLLVRKSTLRNFGGGTDLKSRVLQGRLARHLYVVAHSEGFIIPKVQVI